MGASNLYIKKEFRGSGEEFGDADLIHEVGPRLIINTGPEHHTRSLCLSCCITSMPSTTLQIPELSFKETRSCRGVNGKPERDFDDSLKTTTHNGKNWASASDGGHKMWKCFVAWGWICLCVINILVQPMCQINGSCVKWPYTHMYVVRYQRNLYITRTPSDAAWRPQLVSVVWHQSRGLRNIGWISDHFLQP